MCGREILSNKIAEVDKKNPVEIPAGSIENFVEQVIEKGGEKVRVQASVDFRSNKRNNLKQELRSANKGW